MGQTTEQKVGGVCQSVAHMRMGDRLKVLWALRPWHYATDENGKRWLWDQPKPTHPRS